MQPPSKRIDKQLERIVQRLPKHWQELMVELRAFANGKKIKTPKDLLRVIFLYCGLDMSLREVAGVLTLTEEELTDEAVRIRLKNCADFLEAVVKELLQIQKLPRLPEGRRLLLFDGSTIQGAGAKGIDYRIHLCVNLLNLQFVDLQVSDSKKGESLKNFEILQGDILAADRGYCSVSAVLDTVHLHKADIIVRWKSQNNLYDTEERNQPIQLTERLQDMTPGTTLSFPVVIGYSEASGKKDQRFVRGWIHVYRMTETQAKAAKRKTIKNKTKKQKKISLETVFLSQFVIVLTSLPPEVLSAEDVLTLYRCRWQVELAIKRLKSVLEIDKLRAKRGGQLAKAYLHGKLLYVLLLDEQLRRCFEQDGFGLDSTERKITPWRPTKLVRRAFDAAILQVQRWRPEALEAALRVMMERPRKRTLQSVPQRVLKIFAILEDQDAA